MAKVDFQPQRPHELLAVYPDEATAERVLDDLRKQMSEWTAERGSHADEQASLNAEMMEEMENSWVSPQAGFITTKESTKTAAAMFPLSVIGSLIVAVPISFAFSGDLSAGSRAVLAAGIALIMGGTITLILMSLGQKRPNEPMAAEKGVVVRVHDDREELRRLMLNSHPLRLDVVDDTGRPIENLMSEGDSASPREIGKRMNQWP